MALISGGGGGGSSAVLTSVTDLTAAQLKALVATPVELVPAPGVGKGIVPFTLFVQVKFNSVAFTNPSNEAIFIVTPPSLYAAWDFTTGSGFIPSPGPEIFTQAADCYWIGQPLGNATPLNAPYANESLVLQNFGGNLAAGNGSARFVVYYAIVTLA